MLTNLFEKIKNKIPPEKLLKMMSFWPPYLGAGIKIKNVSKDLLFLDVEMKLHWFNTNYVGTHFGGSLFSMTDPFYMLILIYNLGSEFIVWDKASKIDYKKPGKGLVKAHFEFTQDEIDEIKEIVEKKGKHVFDKTINIFDENGDIIAIVIKSLYVKKR